jgi:hypothetical protein
MIPPFEPNGQLPAGVYTTSWLMVTQHFGINSHRLRLLAGLLEAAQILSFAGSQWILINGSFVSKKEFPQDIDACYDDQTLDYDVLEKLEPVFLDFANARASQKVRFGCEFFPARAVADKTGKTFQDFFQRDRYDQPKGIIKLDLSTLPKQGG